uniref:Homeobox domain-containing protein n=1 Tax=Macrostomum lignano TaxID=282301 RepID=A0A1I8FNN6_9PLAT
INGERHAGDRLKETQLTQRALTSELACLHDRYDECIALLDDPSTRLPRAPPAAVAVTMQNSDRPHQHPPLLALPGVAAALSPAPVKWRLATLRAESDERAGEKRQCRKWTDRIVALHSKREKRQRHCQSIRRRHQQQQQQHHAPSNSRQNNHHHNRNIQLQAAVSVENLRQTVSSPMSSTVELQRDRNRRSCCELAASQRLPIHEPWERRRFRSWDGSGLEPELLSRNFQRLYYRFEFTSAETAAEVSSPKLTLRQVLVDKINLMFQPNSPMPGCLHSRGKGQPRLSAHRVPPKSSPMWSAAQQQQLSSRSALQAAWSGTGPIFNLRTRTLTGACIRETLSGFVNPAPVTSFATSGSSRRCAPRRCGGVATRGDN